MRYLSSISLALIVLMALACTEQSPHGWTPLPENTISPASTATLTEREAVAVIKQYLQRTMGAKTMSGTKRACWDGLNDRVKKAFVGTFDPTASVWTVTNRWMPKGSWEVYEKFLDREAGAVVSIGSWC